MRQARYPIARGSRGRGSFDAVFDGVAPWDSRIAFARNGPGFYTNSVGILVPAAANEPRINYHPITRACRGLLIEEQRTNVIRNNSMAGAGVGVLPTNWAAVQYGSTTVTLSVVGSGTETGIPYVDILVSGTPNASGDFLILPETNLSSASNGQLWAFANYISLAAGSTNNIASIRFGVAEVTAGAAFIRNNEVAVSLPTSGSLCGKRVTTTHTLIGGATVGNVGSQYIAVKLSAGLAINATLRIGAPQFELGDASSSVILTTSAQVTRAADIPVVSGVNFLSWYNPLEGAFVVEFDAASPGSAGYNRVFDVNDGGVSNLLALLKQNGSGAYYFGVTVGGVSQATAAIAANTATKVALAYKANDFALSHNGGAVVTDTSGTVPTVNRLSLCDAGGGGQLNGHIKRLTYYPKRLTNTQLQELSAP